jgi:antitoxin (DNA-binding transcriptional repressor) of toxin-antitoxin stability system
MRISIKEAEGQLTELVPLANQGEEIILTENGLQSARIAPLKKALSAEEKSRVFNEIRERVRKMDLPPGPDAAHSQDFLYDEDGLPK